MDELAEAAAVILATAIESESEEEMELEGKDGVILGNTEHSSTFELSLKDLENQPDEPMGPLCGAANDKVPTGLLTPRSMQRAPRRSPAGSPRVNRRVDSRQGATASLLELVEHCKACGTS